MKIITSPVKTAPNIDVQILEIQCVQLSTGRSRLRRLREESNSRHHPSSSGEDATMPKYVAVDNI